MTDVQSAFRATGFPPDELSAELPGLVQRLALGDRDGYDQLYELLQRRVFGLVVRILRDHEQAKEVTQEVFLQLWQQAARFDAARGSVLAWVMHVAHARAVDRVRVCQSATMRDHRYASTGHRPDTDTVVEQILLNEEQSSVRSALLRLSAAQRESIVLSYYGGMTSAQISDCTGVNASTVKTRIRDGLIKMATELAPTVLPLAVSA